MFLRRNSTQPRRQTSNIWTSLDKVLIGTVLLLALRDDWHVCTKGIQRWEYAVPPSLGSTVAIPVKPKTHKRPHRLHLDNSHNLRRALNWSLWSGASCLPERKICRKGGRHATNHDIEEEDLHRVCVHIKTVCCSRLAEAYPVQTSRRG